ncbi:MAG TPA: hypothetical protein VHH72_02965 [Solirubrobacterales bacterium]|jgi:hypothetical protein|nr:hypothetical protein [Solirubrobacterales bacterium]
MAVRRYAEPGLIAGAVGVAYLIIEPTSADHAAQVFRSGLFEDEGISAWSNLWFGGHHLPGYSVLFPPLGALVGPRLVGVFAIVIASLLFAGIAYRHWGDRARLGVIWFAAGTSVSLFSGRLAFALGIAIALAAVFASQRRWRPLAIAFAVLCPLASPVAGLFLACGAVAQALAERHRAGLELAAGALLTVVLMAWAFPEGGTEPFVFSSFQPAALIAIAVFLAIPREEKLLRYGVAAYGAALAAAFLIDTPMGGNATRMGSLLLGPALAFGLYRRQRFALLLLAPALIYWQWSPVVRDLETVHAQPSVKAGYYAPVRDFLEAATLRQYRVEVVPAEHHWESAYVPHGVYIARGWERQLDRKLNPLFYEDEDGPLTAVEYRDWLDDLAVGFVAVPHSDLDYAGEGEARLIKVGLPYLDAVFKSEDWTVYRVKDPEPLAIGAGDVVKLTPEGFVIDADAPGTILVRVRWTPYWSVVRGTGCVEESPTGFTRVIVSEPGRLRVDVDFSPWRAISRGERCAEGEPPPTGGWEQAAAWKGAEQ